MKAGKLVLRYLYAFFLSLDLMGSALTFGAPMQTISARLAKGEGKATQVFRRALDWFVLHVFREANHCQLSLDAYEARRAAAPSP